MTPAERLLKLLPPDEKRPLKGVGKYRSPRNRHQVARAKIEANKEFSGAELAFIVWRQTSSKFLTTNQHTHLKANHHKVGDTFPSFTVDDVLFYLEHGGPVNAHKVVEQDEDLGPSEEELTLQGMIERSKTYKLEDEPVLTEEEQQLLTELIERSKTYKLEEETISVPEQVRKPDLEEETKPLSPQEVLYVQDKAFQEELEEYLAMNKLAYLRQFKTEAELRAFYEKHRSDKDASDDYRESFSLEAEGLALNRWKYIHRIEREHKPTKEREEELLARFPTFEALEKHYQPLMEQGNYHACLEYYRKERELKVALTRRRASG